MKQFKSNSKDFIAIEVAENYEDFKISGTNYLCGTYLPRMKWDVIEELPEGKWKIILCTNSYKEEDAARLVEKRNPHFYVDYSLDVCSVESATESFESLMESIGCPIVNKYGEEPNVKTFETHSVLDDIEDYNELDEKWKAEQSKIKTFLILEKI